MTTKKDDDLFRAYRDAAPEFKAYVERFAKSKKWTIKQTLRYFKAGKSPKRKAIEIGNPGRVKIYENVLRIEAQKGPGHRCDVKCKLADHRYFHNFKRPYPAMFGNPDKSITIRSK